MAKPREGFRDFFAQIPEALFEALRRDAEQSQRTVTGQLIWLLRQQYPDAAQTLSSAEPAKPARGEKKKRSS